MKLNYHVVTAMKKLITEEGKSQAYVARLFDISDTTVSNLVNAHFEHEAYTARARKPKKKKFITMISRQVKGVKSVVWAKKGV